MGIKHSPAVRTPTRAKEPTARYLREPAQGEVWWVDLDPAVGTEIRKRRPAVIVSPDDMNQSLPRLIVAPLTTHGRPLGCRPEISFKGKHARILLDQIRCIDKSRMVSRMGKIDQAVWKPVLIEMFA